MMILSPEHANMPSNEGTIMNRRHFLKRLTAMAVCLTYINLTMAVLMCVTAAIAWFATGEREYHDSTAGRDDCAAGVPTHHAIDDNGAPVGIP